MSVKLPLATIDNLADNNITTDKQTEDMDEEV
jgi:hypothetical protein